LLNPRAKPEQIAKPEQSTNKEKPLAVADFPKEKKAKEAIKRIPFVNPI